MAAPTNISALTATDLGTLPATVTQNVADAGTTYTVWYSFTPDTSGVVGVFGYGSAAVYTPSTSVYLGPAGAPTLYLNLSAGPNKAVQFPVVAGTAYFLEFTTNGGNPSPASLAISVLAFTEEDYAAGDIFINTFNTNDDAFPAVVISSTDGDDEHLKAFIQPFADGDDGDVLKTSGLMLFERILADDLAVYSTTFQELATVTFPATLGFRRIRSAVDGSKWFIGRGGDGSIRSVLPSGAFEGSWTVTATQVTGGIAANSDETILYHVGPLNNTSIKRFDLVNSIALSDLAAGVANYLTKDIIVLEDDTILVSYIKQTATRDGFVRRYSTAGTVINTYNFGEVAKLRLGSAIDSPTTFWAWTQTVTPLGFSDFHQIVTSDGTETALIRYTQYESGIYDSAATPTPVRFGIDSSCPLIILRIGTAPLPPDSFEIVEDPRRWLRRAPIVSTQNRRVIHDLFCLDVEPGTAQASGADYNTDPQVMMRYSDTAGKTWSNELWRSMGRIGQYKTRLEWWRLGDSRFRVYEVSGNAAVKTVLLAGWIQARPTTDAPQD